MSTRTRRITSTVVRVIAISSIQRGRIPSAPYSASPIPECGDTGTPIAMVWALSHYHLKGDLMFRTLMALLLIGFFASGCNTMAGAGKDIERGGQKIENAAERNK